MNIFKSIAISFSLYSKIPMPVFDWKEKEMKYNLIFFPWVGIVIGLIEVLIWKMSSVLSFPDMASAMIFAAVPLIVTGGFHVDGFMDVEDALSSYADKEKKLEILKDPHIGAFAVIRLAIAILLYCAGLLILIDRGDFGSFIIFNFSFFISRCMSGLSACIFPKAKKSGMLYEETKDSNKAVVIAILIQMLIGIAVMIVFLPLSSVCMLTGGALSILWYWHMTNKNFGGVTGDTAGYLVVNAEILMLIMLDVSLFI